MLDCGGIVTPSPHISLVLYAAKCSYMALADLKGAILYNALEN